MTFEGFKSIAVEIERLREELAAYLELAQGFARVWSREANQGGLTSYGCNASIDERRLVVVLHCSAYDSTMCSSSWDKEFPLSIIFQNEEEQLAAIIEYDERERQRLQEVASEDSLARIRDAFRVLKDEGSLPEE